MSVPYEIETSIGRYTPQSVAAYFWEISVPADGPDSYVEYVLPSTHVDMIVPIVDGLRMGNEEDLVLLPFVSPILKRGIKVGFVAGSKLFGIRFNPIDIMHIIQIPLRSLLQEPNFLEEILPKECYREIQIILETTTNFEQRFKKADAHLAKVFYNRQDSALNLVERCVNYIGENPQCKVRDLSYRSGYSVRWLQKQFGHFLGTTPGELIRITRFNRFVEQVQHNPEKNLTSIALESGYFDQAHAIRDFKEYCTYSPKELRNNFPELIRVMNHL